MSESVTIRSRWWRIRIVVWCVALLVSVGVGFYVRAEIHRRMSRLDNRPSIDFRQAGGSLVIAGGGQLPDSIRQRFVELAGGAKARIVIIPAAVVDEDLIAQYIEGWSRYEVAAVDVLDAESRSEADRPEFSQALATATGVWLGGGTQTWLSGMYRGTLVEQRLKEVLARDGVIGGTSAGAAVMSGVMIASGREAPILGQGFDLIPGAIVDQHFVKRYRFRRLQSALEQHSDLIGLGIDEGTALLFHVKSQRFRVLGNSSVVAIVPQTEGRPMAVEFINSGDDFDMERLRQGIPVPANYVDLDSLLFGE